MKIKNRGNILIVDDSINNIEVLSGILEDEYELLFATTGEKALKIAERSQPDLILLDIVMPEMDGYMIINLLKKNSETAQIPVIFISAKSSTADMLKGFRLGAVDYIAKPFAVEEVSVRVKTHVGMQLLIKDLQKANQQLSQLNREDGLTRIANRRYFDEFLLNMINRGKRHQRPLSLMLIDIDFFKLYNDHYGHQRGDTCLIQVAQKLSQFVRREGELVARYGGEEFAIILAELSQEDVLKHAKQCVHVIEALQIAHEKSTCSAYVTISIGVVTLADPQEMTPEYIIRQADIALYKAKESGRNLVMN